MRFARWVVLAVVAGSCFACGGGQSADLQIELAATPDPGRAAGDQQCLPGSPAALPPEVDCVSLTVCRREGTTCRPVPVADPGLTEMDAMLARIRALPGMVERSAPEIAKALDGEIRRTIAAGTTPDGTPWRATKDGRKPLQNAAKALTTKAIGTVVLARLEGVEARHHLGAIRGSSKNNWLARPILPRTTIPKPVNEAIHTVLKTEFEKTTKGAR